MRIHPIFQALAIITLLIVSTVILGMAFPRHGCGHGHWGISETLFTDC